MTRFIDDIRSSIDNRNWYSAMFVSLCMPDVCGKLENPTLRSKQRYIEWFTKYMSTRYSGVRPFDFLIPENCYALRCAVLHQGEGGLPQPIRQVLDEVCFIAPGSSGIGGFFRPGHCSRLMNTEVDGREFSDALCLHVDVFCEDVCRAVEAWLADMAQRPDVQGRMGDLLCIY